MVNLCLNVEVWKQLRSHSSLIKSWNSIIFRFLPEKYFKVHNQLVGLILWLLEPFEYQTKKVVFKCGSVIWASDIKIPTVLALSWSGLICQIHYLKWPILNLFSVGPKAVGGVHLHGGAIWSNQLWPSRYSARRIRPNFASTLHRREETL